MPSSSTNWDVRWPNSSAELLPGLEGRETLSPYRKGENNRNLTGGGIPEAPGEEKRKARVVREEKSRTGKKRRRAGMSSVLKDPEGGRGPGDWAHVRSKKNVELKRTTIPGRRFLVRNTERKKRGPLTAIGTPFTLGIRRGSRKSDMSI